MLVEFFTQWNVVLAVHSLDAHGIRTRALPFLFGPENFNIHTVPQGETPNNGKTNSYTTPIARNINNNISKWRQLSIIDTMSNKKSMM